LNRRNKRHQDNQTVRRDMVVWQEVAPLQEAT
jgi:hypothetical protein